MADAGYDAERCGGQPVAVVGLLQFLYGFGCARDVEVPGLEVDCRGRCACAFEYVVELLLCDGLWAVEPDGVAFFC